MYAAVAFINHWFAYYAAIVMICVLVYLAFLILMIWEASYLLIAYFKPNWDQDKLTQKYLHKHKGEELSSALSKIRERIDLQEKLLLEKKEVELREGWEKLKQLGNKIFREAKLIKLSNKKIAELEYLIETITSTVEQAFYDENWDLIEMALERGEPEIMEFSFLDESMSELGIADREDLTKSKLKKAYFAQAKLHHPDNGSAGDHAKMTKVNEAKEILDNYVTSTT